MKKLDTGKVLLTSSPGANRGREIRLVLLTTVAQDGEWTTGEPFTTKDQEGGDEGPDGSTEAAAMFTASGRWLSRQDSRENSTDCYWMRSWMSRTMDRSSDFSSPTSSEICITSILLKSGEDAVDEKKIIFVLKRTMFINPCLCIFQNIRC